MSNDKRFINTDPKNRIVVSRPSSFYRVAFEHLSEHTDQFVQSNVCMLTPCEAVSLALALLEMEKPECLIKKYRGGE